MAEIIDLTPHRRYIAKPSTAQRRWLSKGLDSPNGALPRQDAEGREVNIRTIRSCMDEGWATGTGQRPYRLEPMYFHLTDAGRQALERSHG